MLQEMFQLIQAEEFLSSAYSLCTKLGNKALLRYKISAYMHQYDTSVQYYGSLAVINRLWRVFAVWTFYKNCLSATNAPVTSKNGMAGRQPHS
jgi:hypothetical protein